VVLPHSKKTTVQQTNDRNMTVRKVNASAKAKEVQRHLKATASCFKIAFAPTYKTELRTDAV
jgi:hypothetical protein